MDRLSSDQRLLVVDASVAVKWYLRDEEHLREADLLLDHQEEELIELVAPRQIRVEVASSFRRAALRGRISASEVDGLIVDWLETHLTLVDNEPLLLKATRLWLRHGCTLFDGLYIACAAQTQAPLVTADERLLRTIGNRPGLLLSLADYPALPTI